MMIKVKIAFLMAIAAAYFPMYAKPVKSAIAEKNAMSNNEIVYSFTAKDYVQEGLVYHFDAIENVAYGIHDPEATAWIDLVSNVSIPVPAGTLWGVNFMMLPDNNTVYRSVVFPVHPARQFWESGAITVISSQEVINLYTNVSAQVFNMDTLAGGVIKFDLAWGKMNLYNNVCSYNGASQTSYPNYPKGLTQNEADSIVECASWVNEDDLENAYGWTRLNGEIKRLWSGKSGKSFLYNQARTTTYMRRIGIYGSNLKRKLILVYNRILTDEERRHNNLVTKVRFNLR